MGVGVGRINGLEGFWQNFQQGVNKGSENIREMEKRKGKGVVTNFMQFELLNSSG